MTPAKNNVVPLLRGDYPDPTNVRVGNDYYLTHSANQNCPGLLIWHSRDLLNWRPLTTALTGHDGDIWARDIVFQDALSCFVPTLWMGLSYATTASTGRAPTLFKTGANRPLKYGTRTK